MTCDISVVIPALNEEKTIGVCVSKALVTLQEMCLEGEVVVADNGSIDRTVAVAQSVGARVVRILDKGYGFAYLGGLSAARGKFLIMGDADDSYHFDEMGPFIEKLKQGYDFVIGNRFKGKIEKNSMPWLHRYLGTPVLTGIMNLFFKTGIGDTNCGMRGLTKETFEKMDLKVGGMEFATEMIVKASLLKIKIAEIPCNLYKDKRNRKPHLRTWHDGWRHLRFLLLFSPQWTFLAPALILGGLGLTGMVILFLRDLFVPQLWVIFLTQKHMLSSMLIFFLGTHIFGLGLTAEAYYFSMGFSKTHHNLGGLMNKYFRLERGLLCGGFLVLLSLLSFLYLLISYCGVLPSVASLLRFDLAVFAMAFLLLGIQMIFLSFLLSLFNLQIK